MHSASGSQPVTVDVTGAHSERDQQYVADKIRQLSDHAHRPITTAHVVIEHATNPASSWRVKAGASVTIGARHLHASAEGDTFRHVLDTVYQRLHTQLARQGR